ncbi:class I SAM-dependent methyltransferase [Paralimibaculum aggregatum]|uniref:Class I SAM-dependent methyltransferase n=1 Tax=Paralimibaculum aggregatum TaxID=3036245 RepID=A0ABQ6LQ01_9RHOB|nr:crosslink repair DNA glycosylase YcaQ family protein [Limibaculum sp. NKW23]GMG84545.1 class I SAM-dependent methyltransferase [Limibaculum sp. NKW23]
MNEEKLMALLGRIVGDLGAAYSVPLVRMGEQLGLYAALRDHGPQTSGELADNTGCAERYIREWLANQAAGGYVEHDAAAGTFWLTPEQVAVFADPAGPVYMLGAFDNAISGIENQPKVQAAFRTGDGVAWGDQASCMFCAVAKFFRPGYRANLIETWLPSLDGVADRLRKGGRIADIGCGHGHSTLMMAEAFPNAEVVGFDFHAASIAEARAHASTHDLPNLRFEVAAAKDFAGGPFDLITFFDCLHDMGDPVGAVSHARERLGADGALMIVEPMAADTVAGNLNPVGRLYYAASTMICLPTSLAQEEAAGLGAQAGEARLRAVIRAGGLGRVRRASETPFNMVLEARA